MDLTPALPIFIITLREGFEAALVVGIVFACLAKAEQTALNRWVYQGVAGGIVASIMVGCLLAGILQEVSTGPNPYSPVLKLVLAALFGLMAIAMLSWMLLWMTQQARSLRASIAGEIQRALSQESAGKSVALVVFIAVLREGFETVLFILSQWQSGGQSLLLGAIAGLGTASLLGYLLFAVGLKINIKAFFGIMGTLLLLIVAGLVVSLLKNIDLAVQILGQINPTYQSWCFSQDSCLLGPQIWDGSAILPDHQLPGLLLKTLFGYRDRLYLFQGIAYSLFLGGMGSLYAWQIQASATTPARTEKALN